MHILRRFLVLLLLLPLLEVIAFAVVAVAIGFWNAVLLSLGTSLAGGLLLKYAGQARFHEFRHSMNGGIEISAAGGNISTVFAGVLLLIPGFLTDVAAILLLIAPVRRLLASAFANVLRTQSGPAGPSVVDLDPDEWRNEPQNGGRRPSLPRQHPD
jgi:UPF0716 protein FxsA